MSNEVQTTILGDSPPALRAAYEALGKHDQSDPNQALVLVKCAALIEGYHHRWQHEHWTTHKVEREFLLPVVNPDTGRSSRNWQQAGKRDVVASRHGKVYLVEHKSTSEAIDDPGGTYWRQLAIDSQVSQYMLSHWQEGRRLDGTLYDVIRKPTIRPRKLTKADRYTIGSLGEYQGHKLPPAQIESVLAGQVSECLTLYAARLQTDTKTRPDFYFQRKLVPRMDAELLEWASELWDVSKTITEARQHDRHYRNSAACMTWGRPCQYLGLCSGTDTPESDNWMRTDRIHDELDECDNGRNVLTHSRIRTFQLCRRKHYHHYEQGLRRVREDDAEALYFGTLLHEALAAWWQTMGEDRDDSNTTTAGLVQNRANHGGAQADTSDLHGHRGDRQDFAAGLVPGAGVPDDAGRDGLGNPD